METVTLLNGKSLPQICAINGATDAPVKISEEVECGPQWVWVTAFFPFGFFFLLILIQLTHKKFDVTYYLSQQGHTTLQSRRRTLYLSYGILGLAFAGSIYYSIPWLMLFVTITLPGTLYARKKINWPFLVAGYDDSTITLTRLPAPLVTAFHQQAAVRPNPLLAGKRPSRPVAPGVSRPKPSAPSPKPPSI